MPSFLDCNYLQQILKWLVQENNGLQTQHVPADSEKGSLKGTVVLKQVQGQLCCAAQRPQPLIDRLHKIRPQVSQPLCMQLKMSKERTEHFSKKVGMRRTNRCAATKIASASCHYTALAQHEKHWGRVRAASTNQLSI